MKESLFLFDREIKYAIYILHYPEMLITWCALWTVELITEDRTTTMVFINVGIE